MDGGSDRFAPITGRIHTLDTASPPPTPVSHNPQNANNDQQHHHPPPQPSPLVLESTYEFHSIIFTLYVNFSLILNLMQYAS